MQIVIEISEEEYQRAKENKYIFPPCEVYQAIRNGIPLPKYHGDLVDRNSFEYLKAIHDAIHGEIAWSGALQKIRDSAPTIIPATKRSRK